MSLTRRGVSAALCVPAALLLAACAGASDPSSTASAGSGAAATAGDHVRPFDARHRGGTLTVLASSAAGSLDPQVNYTGQFWQLYRGVYDGLVAFAQVSGQGSFTVVPDLAEAIPVPSNGGRTYTFTLRKKVAFSDGREVTTDDVVASFRRIFTVSSPTAGTFFKDIVGAAACLKTPAGCTLAGGVVGDAAAGTVTINLTAPDPQFLYKLAVPHASILPKDAPATDAGTRPVVGTGAYRFTSYDPNSALVLERNPHFTEWSRQAQPQGYPDSIVERFGQSVTAAVTAVENGQADVVYDDLPADRLPELGSRFADQVHVNPLTALWFLPMNVNLAPFDRLPARQAVNWAVDRSAIVTLFGGPNLAAPVCTVLPPGIPGHRDECQYTQPAGSTWSGRDLARARQLVQASGTAGQSVQVVVADDEVSRAIGENVASTLTSIGWKATAKVVSGNIQLSYIENTKNKVQISLTQWSQDYPAASDFLDLLLGCDSFVPDSDTSANIPGYCDRGVQAKMDQAQALDGGDPGAAAALWSQVDHEVMTASPIAPLITPKDVDFVSRRVGDYQWSKQYQLILSQLWVQ